MAQLNPNFEIDYSDINSYEQIQLLNDAQLAKENLLMHRAYKEPSDDEIIRNRFSSFTFVDFCPRLYTSTSPNGSLPDCRPQAGSNDDKSTTEPPEYFQLEKFSDLFERMNNWLKLNKDWRVASMQTLIYDFHSHFNHLKSSIYSQFLPRNMRGLRLYLSPSRSKFSGPQKIGCINVVPRKMSGSHSSSVNPVRYETLDEILERLNELLLTKKIEGRILSVDTITLPLVRGYVDTESNYVPDGRLIRLYQRTYCAVPPQSPEPRSGGEHLIDILRVYYEFGPTMCGLVNVIDFVPRFYSPTPTDLTTVDEQQVAETDPGSPLELVDEPKFTQKMLATESMTRLIRRSLAWFEAERKVVLAEQSDIVDKSAKVSLKLCNLQVLQKTVTKKDLLRINGSSAIDILNTRSMGHKKISANFAGVTCEFCPDKLGHQTEASNWCIHAQRLSRLYDVKYVRLAYVIPIRQSRAMGSIQISDRWRFLTKPPKAMTEDPGQDQSIIAASYSSCSGYQLSDSSSSLHSSQSSDAHEDGLESEQRKQLNCCGSAEETKKETGSGDQNDPLGQSSLAILRATTERHTTNERLNQSKELDDPLNNSPVGQLTYRLFAPCQLVTSSSCFSINPVNSSSPLSRRGSVNLNGTSSSPASGQSGSTLRANTGGVQFSGALPSELVESARLNSRIQDFAGQLSMPDVIKSAVSGLPSGPGGGRNGSGQRQALNGPEQVDAIKRRMEVYVTTNLMKVVAGETIVVNLSNALSCLSSAIEQTVVESQHTRLEPSTWVSVHLLYVGVGEPQLPQQLLAQQKIRELIANKSLSANPTEEEVDCLFDTDFDAFLNTCAPEAAGGQSEPEMERLSRERTSSQSFCNAAYERTVALPTKPDEFASGGLDPSVQLDLFGASMCQAEVSSHGSLAQSSEGTRQRAGKRKSRHNDLQCSIM